MIRRQWRIARGNLTSCDTNPQLTRSRAGEDLPTLSAMTPATSVPRPDRRLLVLDTAVGAFLARPDLAPRSRTVYGQTLTRLITDLGPPFPVAELSGAELSAFLQRYYGHAAPATWNLNLAALRSFLAFCTRHGALQADPSTAIERRTLRYQPRPAGHPHHPARGPLAPRRPPSARENPLAPGL
jgi:hypothetical protein